LQQHNFDEAWRQRALQGDPTAVKEFCAAVLEPLYAFCLYRVGRDPHLCEEVVQETMLRAFADLGNYDPPRANHNIFPWLTGLARNEIHRVLQREKHGLSLEALWAKMDKELLSVFASLDSEPFNEELLRREETRDLVNATMSQLPPHYREALEGKYLGGKSVRDLAHSWKVSEKTVESQLTRARKAFRATFLTLSAAIVSS
jgi:RNA polymerase sigma-70 factor, ECF subfamily